MAWQALVGLATAGLGFAASRNNKKAAAAAASAPASAPPSGNGGFWPTTAQGWAGLGGDILGLVNAGQAVHKGFQGSAAVGKSGAEAGEWMKDYRNTAFPNLTEWEHSGVSGMAGTGGAVASAQESSQRQLQAAQGQMATQMALAKSQGLAMLGSNTGDQSVQDQVLRYFGLEGGDGRGIDRNELNEAQADFWEANIEVSSEQLQLDYNMQSEERIAKFAELFAEAVKWDYHSGTTSTTTGFTMDNNLEQSGSSGRTFGGDGRYRGVDALLGGAAGFGVGMFSDIGREDAAAASRVGKEAADLTDDVRFGEEQYDNEKRRRRARMRGLFGTAVSGTPAGRVARGVGQLGMAIYDRINKGIKANKMAIAGAAGGAALAGIQGGAGGDSVSQTGAVSQLNQSDNMSKTDNPFDYERWKHIAGNKDLPPEQRGILGELMSKVYAEARYRIGKGKPDDVTMRSTWREMVDFSLGQMELQGAN